MSAEATAWVWRNSRWRGSNHVRFLLHLAVADVVNDVHDNLFWMAQGSLAEKVGCRRATVSEWIQEAVDVGLLEVVDASTDRAGQPNVYRFVYVDEGVRSPDRGCTVTVQGGVRSPYTKLKTQHNRTKDDTATTTAQRVVDAWVQATNRDSSRVKVNAKRLAAVRARLSEGYSEDDLVAAARGIACSSWHMGDNPDRKRFDDLLVAIRDGERVERFRDLFLGADAGDDRRPGSVTAQAMRRRTGDGS